MRTYQFEVCRADYTVQEVFAQSEHAAKAILRKVNSSREPMLLGKRLMLTTKVKPAGSTKPFELIDPSPT